MDLYAEKVSWPVMHDSNGEISVVAEMWVDAHKENLFPNEAGVNFVKEKQYLNTLSNYYAQVIKGDVSKLDLMFSDVDKSKGIFQDSLKRHPDKYTGYKDVETVDSVSNTKWGAYNITVVKLEGNGQKMHWREAVICESDRCKISNFLNTIDETQQIFTAIQKDYYKNQSTSGSVKSLISKSGLVSKKNAAIVLPPSSLIKGLKQVPIVLFPKVEKKSAIVNLAASSQIKAYPEAELITEFVKKLQLLELVRQDDGAAEYPELEKLMVANWVGYKKGRSLPIFQHRKKDQKGKVLPSLEKQSYLVFSLYEYVKKWDSINFIGSIKGQDRDYVLFSPIINKIKQPVQVFCLAKDKSNKFSFSMLKTRDYLSKIIINSSLMSFLDTKISNTKP